MDCSGTPKVCAPLWGAVTGYIGGGSPAVVNGVLYINVSGDSTVYAYDLAGAYSVTYNGNGATAGTVPVDPSSPYLPGATVTVLANTGGLVDTGYTFAGWNTAANGSGNAYAASGSATFTMPAADVMLYAQWTANATDTITFNSEGGSAVASVMGLNGTTITLPAAPTYAGHTFDGWFTAPSGGTALTSPYTLTASTTLYAQWTANATDTITFNSEGGSAVASHGPQRHHHHLAGGTHLRRPHLRRLVHRPERRHGAHLALHPDRLDHPLRPVDGECH